MEAIILIVFRSNILKETLKGISRSTTLIGKVKRDKRIAINRLRENAGKESKVYLTEIPDKEGLNLG